MSGVHPDLGPELRKLAQVILDGIDPAVRAAAALAAGGDAARCQQVWCPVCALAALVSGEQHPLLSVIAEHSTTLLAVIRAMVAGHEGQREDHPPPDGPPGDTAGDSPAGDETRYERIHITVEE